MGLADRAARALTRRLRRPIGVAVATLSLATVQASAQVATSDEGARAAFVSDLVEHLALLDLGVQLAPKADDYAIAMHLLSVAADLDPRDANLRREVISAAWSAGDQGELLESTRKLLSIDPRDTVAQLRLITARITQHQTAEERLEAYARFLGPQGERLDPSVRSRLALDAALLARELGDEDRFVRLLSLATSLDMTNKEAAAMAQRFHAERRDIPSEQLEMLVNLLYADPIDPNVHEAIAALLAQEGAYLQASRFILNSVAVRVAAGQGGIRLQERRLIYTWHAQGPQAVLDQLNDQLARDRNRLAVSLAVEDAAKLDLPTFDRPKVEDVRLDPSLDRLRILAAAALGDQGTLDAAAADMIAETDRVVQQLAEASQSTDEQTQQRALLEIASWFNQLHFVRLLVGYRPAFSAQALQGFVELAPDMRRAIAPLVPWITLRLDDADLEMAEQQKVLITEPTARRLFEAELALKRGQKREAAEAYLDVLRAEPDRPLALWAHAKLTELTGATDLRSPQGRQMDEFARSVDFLVDAMCRNPLEFSALSIEPVRPTLTPIEHAQIRVRIQNTSPIPLAFGAGRPISSRILVQPSVDTGAATLRGDPQPLVLDLNQRLRLNSLETLEVVVPADSPFTRWLLDTAVGETIRERWRVLQGFLAPSGGLPRAGPLSLSADMRGSVVRLALPAANASPAELARRVRSDPRDDLPMTLAAVRAFILDPALDDASRAIDESAIEDMMAAALERYERSDSLDRAIMLAILPHARLSKRMVPFEQGVRDSFGARVTEGGSVTELETAVLLLTRAASAEDAVFRLVEAGSSRRLAEVARLMRARYQARGFGYATVANDPRTLSGPTLNNLRERAERQAREQNAGAPATPGK